jgi:unsaturated rhamnogalacturonyl hydrolase
MVTNDTNTPLHLLEPDYAVPYGLPSRDSVADKLGRVLAFLQKSTPAGFVLNEHRSSHVDAKSINEFTTFAQGDFRLTSYEWGVTYAGMLLAGDVLSDRRFTTYAAERLRMIADLTNYCITNGLTDIDKQSPVCTVLEPKALDDAGALCAAMIKAKKAGLEINLTPLINNFIRYISEREYRLADGTFARNRPYANTLWLDDLFMSLPALALYADITNESKYFDDAVQQIDLFSKRMFIKEKGIYVHGWVEGMDFHPQFCWGRANGWASMAMAELLTVLPVSHAGYGDVLNQFRAHVGGLAKLQAGTGFWHQLLDRTDSFLETSATAIITYSIARAINLGIIDERAYGPTAVLGWNAVSTRISNDGQVGGTCVGTGMGFDQAFYYHRPVSVFAGHGYGPVLLAGAEILTLMERFDLVMNEKSLQVRGKF